MPQYEQEREKVLLSIRKDYLTAIDGLVTRGAAASRSELAEKIIGGFLADLREKRKPDSALGALIGFFTLLLGVAAIASLFED